MPASSRELMVVLLQATLLLAASAVLVRGLVWLLRAASPQVQRVAWLLVLVQGVILVRLPIRVPWYEAAPALAPDAGVEVAVETPPQDATAHPLLAPAIADRDVSVGSVPTATPSVHSSGANAAPPFEPSAANAAPPVYSPGANWLLLLWAAGMLLVPACGTWKYLRFLRRIRGTEPAEEAWTDQWRTLVATRRVRPIPLRATSDVGPALCLLPSGYAVLVPTDVWRGLSVGQREGVLRHELAHYERGDLWKSLFVRLLALPHWFNPAAWWAVRKFDECTEWLCDDAAVAKRPDGHDFAQALVQLGTLGTPHASALSAARGRLFHRIRRLLAASAPEDSKMKKSLLLLAASLLLLLCAFRLQLVAKERAEVPPEAGAAAERSVDQANAIAEIEKLNGKVTVDENAAGKPVIGVVLRGQKVTDAALVYLAGLTQLQSLDLTYTKVTDAGLVHLKGLTQLQNLDLTQAKVTDAGLAQLEGLKQLQSLVLECVPVTDAGLAHLAGLTHLQSLDLWATGVTDAGLVHLQGLTQLRSLRLASTNVTDAGLAHLEGLIQLQSLDLWSPGSPGLKITDAGLAHLQRLTRLQVLNLAATKVTSAGIVHLKGLAGLQSLDLSSTKVGDAGLVHLRGLTQLRDLGLAHTQVTDAGLVHLQGLIRLERLNLDGPLGPLNDTAHGSFTVTFGDPKKKVGKTLTHSWPAPAPTVTDAGLAYLEKLTELRDLDLGSLEITDAGLVHLEGLTQLRSLDLSGARLSDAGLSRLKALSRLQKLDLMQTDVTDAGMVSLEGLTQLQDLNLMNTGITDAGLAHLKGLSDLQSLNLVRAKVTDAGLVYLEGMTKLQKLNLWGTRIGDAGLVHLKGLTHLRSLDLSRTKITEAGVKSLATALPHCYIVCPDAPPVFGPLLPWLGQ